MLEICKIAIFNLNLIALRITFATFYILGICDSAETFNEIYNVVAGTKYWILCHTNEPFIYQDPFAGIMNGLVG